MGLLTGKRALIVGLASNRSIASGIAEAFHREGAELAFTYQNDKLKSRVEEMAAKWDSKITLPCDVASDQEISAMYEALSRDWSDFHILVHSVAFAPPNQLTGNYADVVDRAGFQIAHDISAYSLAALTQAARSFFADPAAVLTLTYLGSERVVPNYNVMGCAKASLEANVRYLAASLGPKHIRVNGISAGPIRTLAASGIKQFRRMLDFHEKAAPLKQNVTIEQVGNAAAFLCSDYASGITGEILHVDSGYHIMGMSDVSAIEEANE